MKIGFWAQLDDAEAKPALMLGSLSPEDAAAAFAQRLIEESEGGWLAGAIRVWEGNDGAAAIVFDVSARFVPSEEDEGEFDCELEIIERD